MGFVTRMSVLILIYFLRLSMKQAAAETASARLTPSVSFADSSLKEGALYQVIFYLGDKSKMFL